GTTFAGSRDSSIKNVRAPRGAAARGSRRRPKVSKVRVAIAGAGNCASSLIQGVEFYRDTPLDEDIPGLMHNVLGSYEVGDIEFVCAFDVDAAKVGRDLGEAIFASENNTLSFADVGQLGTAVLRGPTF